MRWAATIGFLVIDSFYLNYDSGFRLGFYAFKIMPQNCPSIICFWRESRTSEPLGYPIKEFGYDKNGTRKTQPDTSETMYVLIVFI